jgi:hypothetical protein
MNNKLMKSLLIVIAWFVVMVGIVWLSTKFPTIVGVFLALGIFGMMWKMAYESLD